MTAQIRPSILSNMLGSADTEAEEQGEEAALESAKANNQIGVDVIEGFFAE